MPVVCALGRLCVTRYLAPRGVKDNPMGCGDDGNDPVALAQTGCPCTRVQGSDQDFVPLVVSGGAGVEAEFDLMSLRASDLAGPVSAIESPSGSSAKRRRAAPGG